MRVLSRTISSALVLILLVGCSNLPGGISQPTAPGSVDPKPTQANATTSPVELTGVSPTEQVVHTGTPKPELTATGTQQAQKTPGDLTQVTRTAGCNLAAAGRPIDVTIPDNTRINLGDAFLKTWRLVNVGTCTWTKGYSVVWFSGEDLAYREEERFREDVLPGQTIDLSIDMVAPKKAGFYQSNWKLRDENGELFGIGPNAAAPFWVKIEVVDPEAVALTPFATRTPISEIFSAGNAVLTVGQSYDFDGVQPGPAAGDDVFLRLTNDMVEIVPINGTRIVAMEGGSPNEAECAEAQALNSPIILGDENQNGYFCLWTDQGHPASVFIARVDALKGSVDIHFTVWMHP